MRRIVLISGVVSSLMSVAVTVVAMSLAIPAAVGAQQARYPEFGTTILGRDGTERIRLGTGPGFFAAVHVLAPDGYTPRVELATGGTPRQGSTVPEAAGVNLFALDGTLIGRLGTFGPETGGVNLVLSDRDGRNRVRVAVGEDGSPYIELLREDGTPILRAP